MQDHIIENQWGFNGIPRSPVAGTTELQWFSSDNRKNFINNKVTNWAEDAFIYRFNSHGYRSEEFVGTTDFVIATYGCSNTMGIGNPYEHTWPYLFQQKLIKQSGKNVNLFNFGWGGASSDFVCRILYSSLPVVKPDLVIIQFPKIHRYEFFQENGEALNILPKSEPYSKFYELFDTEVHAKNNFLKNFLTIKTILELYCSKWLYTLWDNTNHIEIDFHENCVDPVERRPIGGFARDGIHRTKPVFEKLADALFNKYNELY